MFRQNREPAPAEAISGQAYEQRVEADPYAPTPRSRLDSYRAQQGKAVGAVGQLEQQPPADALTPRRRLDSFRQQQGQPVAPLNGGLASPPSVPGLVCHAGLEPRASRQGPWQVVFCYSHV